MKLELLRFSLAAETSSLVFILSDYHWSLDGLVSALDPLADALVVPVVVWDPVETEPPSGSRLLSVQQMGAAQSRHLWLTPKLKQQWVENVEQRKRHLSDVFATRDIKPFIVTNGFDCEAMSEYFMGLGLQ